MATDPDPGLVPEAADRFCTCRFDRELPPACAGGLPALPLQPRRDKKGDLMSPMILQRDPAWYVRHCCLCGRSLAGVATADPIRITRDGVPVEARACRTCDLIARME